MPSKKRSLNNIRKFKRLRQRGVEGQHEGDNASLAIIDGRFEGSCMLRQGVGIENQKFDAFGVAVLAARRRASESSDLGSEAGMRSLAHSAWPFSEARRRAGEYGSFHWTRSLTHSAWPCSAAVSRAAEQLAGGMA